MSRRALDRILKDEVRHRDFGWTALGWLMTTPRADAIAQTIREGLPGWLEDLERSYGDALPDGNDAVSDDERAWGIAPAREFADILHRTIARDYPRRFARAGLEGAVVISSRPRASS